jgi:tetratricopeptide (TPR) repeat protein
VPDEPLTPNSLPRKPLCVNRTVEMDDLQRRQTKSLAAGEPFLILLGGRQGVGKTTLAVTLAYALRKDYPGGQLFCDARSPDPRTTLTDQELAEQLLLQLGVARDDIPGEGAARRALLRNRLAGRRVLIVFDDISTANQVEPLLGETSRAAIIVTGRYRLKALENAGFHAVRLAGFDDEAAGALLGAVGGATAHAVEPRVLARLCSLCGRLPLALTVSAGWLGEGIESAEDFVHRLETGAPLEELEVDDDLVVKSVFDAAYQVLDPEEAWAYRLLSLIPGPHFGVTVAATALLRDEREVLRLLRRLTGKYLLEDFGAGRYQYPGLIREHASGLARARDSEADREGVVVRANRWRAHRAVALDRVITRRPAPRGCGELYQTIEPAYTGPTAAELATAEFDREWSALVASAYSSTEHRVEDLDLVLPVALWSFGYRTSRCNHLIDLYHRALEPDREPAVRWQLLRDLGGLYEQLGETAEARKHLGAAAEAGYPAGTASALEWLAFVHENEGRFTDALDALAESRRAISLMGDAEQEKRSFSLNDMHTGRILTATGRLDEAEESTRSAAEYFADFPAEQHNLARCREKLGEIARERDAPDTAQFYWTQAVDAYWKLGMRDRVIAVLDRLAMLADEQGHAEDAARYRDQLRTFRAEEG